MKRLFLLSIFMLSFSSITYANNVIQEHANGQEGQLVYHIKYNYDAIYKLLGIDQKIYEQYWENGLSIAEMAEKQGIVRHDLEAHFVAFHYQEMQKWREKGAMNEHHYFDMVYRLKEEITEFIDRNPNRT
ncbi:hypothetical protein FOH38_20645 [Lysinibacillus fusiformis]|nr:hypothetical protein FOH38_20645 [Lysinibacillus fusiformis]